MFMYAFILSDIQREFPRYTKPVIRELQTRIKHDLVFVKKIHVMSFVFDFLREIVFLFNHTVSHVQFLMLWNFFLKTSSNMR